MQKSMCILLRTSPVLKWLEEFLAQLQKAMKSSTKNIHGCMYGQINAQFICIEILQVQKIINQKWTL